MHVQREARMSIEYLVHVHQVPAGRDEAAGSEEEAKTNRIPPHVETTAVHHPGIRSGVDAKRTNAQARSTSAATLPMRMPSQKIIIINKFVDAWRLLE